MYVFTRVVWPSGALEIRCPDIDAKCTYYFCTKKQAMRRFRDSYGLRYKRLIVIDT